MGSKDLNLQQILQEEYRRLLQEQKGLIPFNPNPGGQAALTKFYGNLTNFISETAPGGLLTAFENVWPALNKLARHTRETGQIPINWLNKANTGINTTLSNMPPETRVAYRKKLGELGFFGPTWTSLERVHSEEPINLISSIPKDALESQLDMFGNWPSSNISTPHPHRYGAAQSDVQTMQFSPEHMSEVSDYLGDKMNAINDIRQGWMGLINRARTEFETFKQQTGYAESPTAASQTESLEEYLDQLNPANRLKAGELIRKIVKLETEAIQLEPHLGSMDQSALADIANKMKKVYGGAQEEVGMLDLGAQMQAPLGREGITYPEGGEIGQETLTGLPRGVPWRPGSHHLAPTKAASAEAHEKHIPWSLGPQRQAPSLEDIFAAMGRGEKLPWPFGVSEKPLTKPKPEDIQESKLNQIIQEETQKALNEIEVTTIEDLMRAQEEAAQLSGRDPGSIYDPEGNEWRPLDLVGPGSEEE